MILHLFNHEIELRGTREASAPSLTFVVIVQQQGSYYKNLITASFPKAVSVVYDNLWIPRHYSELILTFGSSFA